MGSWRRGAGWPDRLARPWGQRQGPARPGEPLQCAGLPSSSLRVPGQGMSCSRRSLPGARGQGGSGGVSPLLLPTSSPPRCEPEPPPPRPPLTHAAPGLAGRRVWDRVRGWGARRAAGEPAPPGGRAVSGRASERALPAAAGRRLSSCTPGAPARRRRPLAKAMGCGPVGGGPLFRSLPAGVPVGQRRGIPSLPLGLNPPPSVHSLFCWSC